MTAAQTSATRSGSYPVENLPSTKSLWPIPPSGSFQTYNTWAVTQQDLRDQPII
ncbi:hypothetical protein PISMIDRAFT_675029, partial [Pisolithus microcarpus 441]